jgi:hypothetical protein
MEFRTNRSLFCTRVKAFFPEKTSTRAGSSGKPTRNLERDRFQIPGMEFSYTIDPCIPGHFVQFAGDLETIGRMLETTLEDVCHEK